ncbi:hypothetical protein BCR39DRAFT_549041 [Naematelia encephala]|uniref:Uncharacterized protein n=1 Tax=Naematelia encephala TaxID=71784 RepID=A0A1Y2AM28_9TREE|nr:hypothetical protein BCR39DRAFT_549041 [Naematelia encephala]
MLLQVSRIAGLLGLVASGNHALAAARLSRHVHHQSQALLSSQNRTQRRAVAGDPPRLHTSSLLGMSCRSPWILARHKSKGKIAMWRCC